MAGAGSGGGQATSPKGPLLEDVGDQTDALQAILHAIRRARGPLVVHNGLLDLVFLYHALIGPLPASVEVRDASLALSPVPLPPLTHVS